MHVTLEDVISYMENTTEESWNLDTVRSKDGVKNCFFGHLFNMGSNDKESSDIWDWFEGTWSTTYVIYPINDGENPDYQQATARERILAYLRNLQNGTEPDTITMMEQEAERWLSLKATEEAAQSA